MVDEEKLRKKVKKLTPQYRLEEIVFWQNQILFWQEVLSSKHSSNERLSMARSAIYDNHKTIEILLGITI